MSTPRSYESGLLGQPLLVNTSFDFDIDSLPSWANNYGTITNEGKLLVLSGQENMSDQWVNVILKEEVLILKGEEIPINIDLLQYQSVRTSKGGWCKRETKSFYLVPKYQVDKDNPAQKYEFQAPSIKDRDEWMECLRRFLPDEVGTTVQWTDSYETMCSYWFIILFVIMAIILFIINLSAFNVPTAQKTVLIPGFRILLSLYELSTIILCSGYCLSFEQPLKKILSIWTFNKFFCGSLFCSIFNLITFILLTTHLFIKLSKNNLSSDKYYYIINSNNINQ